MFDPDASAKEKKNKKNLNKRRQIIYLAVDSVIQIWKKKKMMKMMMQGNRNLGKGHGTEAEDDGCWNRQVHFIYLPGLQAYDFDLEQEPFCLCYNYCSRLDLEREPSCLCYCSRLDLEYEPSCLCYYGCHLDLE